MLDKCRKNRDLVWFRFQLRMLCRILYLHIFDWKFKAIFVCKCCIRCDPTANTCMTYMGSFTRLPRFKKLYVKFNCFHGHRNAWNLVKTSRFFPQPPRQLLLFVSAARIDRHIRGGIRIDVVVTPGCGGHQRCRPSSRVEAGEHFLEPVKAGFLGLHGGACTSHATSYYSWWISIG